MLNFIKFLDSLQNVNEDELKEAIMNKIGNSEMSNYLNWISPGSIVDMQINDDICHGIVLSNNALMLINPKLHKVVGYLTNYTDVAPYKILRIRKPNIESYKYTDPNVPVMWECESNKKTEMSIDDIEKALGIKSGTLIIK